MSGAPPAAPERPSSDLDRRPAILRAAETLRRTAARRSRSVDDRRLEAAFLDTVAAFRDPSSPERRRLDPALCESAALSQGCLDASLDALCSTASAPRRCGASSLLVGARVAAGARRRGARLAPATRSHRRRARATPRASRGDRERAGDPPHLIVLAANLPGIALAPLLASLARAPSGDPQVVVARAVLRARVRRRARGARAALGDALAAVVWRGGDQSIESPLLARGRSRWSPTAARSALADLRRRAGRS